MGGKRLAGRNTRCAEGTRITRRSASARERRDKTVMIVMIVLAVLMTLAAAVTVFWSRTFVKPTIPAPGEPSAPEDDPAESDDPAPEDGVRPLSTGLRKSEDFFTILIFGSDIMSGNTDTIMVASYDVTNQKATVMSIPRDTIYNSPSRSIPKKMINSVYDQAGGGRPGAEALKTEVSKLVGFVPDYYVQINWEIVGKMVEAIDGVDFYIPWHMWYEDDDQNLHIEFEEGMCHLNGQEAMNLVRWRKNNDGSQSVDSSDITRLQLQHDFLAAVLKQTLKPQNIVKVPELVRLFDENVESDLKMEEMLWFGQAAVLGGLGVDDVNFTTMPYYGVDKPGAVYLYRLFPLQSELIPLINESLNPYVEDVTIDQLDLMSVSADGNHLSSSTGHLKDPTCG